MRIPAARARTMLAKESTLGHSKEAAFINIYFSGEVSKMAQWVKALVTKPDDMSLIPGTYKVMGEN